MIVSIWRNSHLALAISSFLVLLVACVTGICLAFEPVIQKTAGFKSAALDTLNVGQVIGVVKSTYPDATAIELDDNGFVSVRYTNPRQKEVHDYINPVDGKVLGPVHTQSPFFQWMTAAHRSLFLHETGRVIVGITAFLLLMIALSGIALIIKRQNGFMRFFARMEKKTGAAYYHATFGRLCLIFILFIAISGTYLAVYRYQSPQPKATQHIDENKLTEDPVLNTAEFSVFRKQPFRNVKLLQFPFSDFPEDYYYLQLKDRELCVNQFNGVVLSEVYYSTAYQLQVLSLRWHTGRNSIIWAILLAISSGYILFFIYSGFRITLNRRQGRLKNKWRANQADIIILVGSENGSTFRFGKMVYQQLIRQNQKVYITNLSQYQRFDQAKHLLIMTSTYGQGVAPSNAVKFIDRLKDPKLQPSQKVFCSVVGFGSRAYPDYCKYGSDLHELLLGAAWSEHLLPFMTVNDVSLQDFEEWLRAWSEKAGILIELDKNAFKTQSVNLNEFKVLDNSGLNTEQNFTMQLCPAKNNFNKKHIQSGDLLIVYPKGDHRERLYSIGLVGEKIVLSVKLMPGGLGSGYLYAHQKGDIIKAKVLKNSHFHFPNKAKRLIMISNGTGIAPFLGHIYENKRGIPITLFCGFRTWDTFNLYKDTVEEAITQGRLENYCVALSRERQQVRDFINENNKIGLQKYVSHLLVDSGAELIEGIRQNAVIMICGSLAMQKDVLQIIDTLCLNNHLPDCQSLIDSGQILSDCY
ncbi:sulfite reductase (NADPH) flavoprotein alpha-component [Arachidicoccus rhizosphaerae]|uniref:NADPH--hemoprotein reductase n=1 Tax=Arachidicoccus rhizosphaerae TaxID=551991 RepID=A0A1H3Y6P3_9BACT|nr:PepSY domain-containing protein [Arachidicoccus rhizosphaerae]SEA06528.1 sulfite reductase (NADPH) flavoprotein alpha-component [Arachidicoccus rhizosphaerae]